MVLAEFCLKSGKKPLKYFEPVMNGLEDKHGTKTILGEIILVQAREDCGLDQEESRGAGSRIYFGDTNNSIMD